MILKKTWVPVGGVYPGDAVAIVAAVPRIDYPGVDGRDTEGVELYYLSYIADKAEDAK